MIENELIIWLKANVALCGGRVYAKKLPQNPTLPALTLTQVSGAPWKTHQGPCGVADGRYRINCYGPDYEGAKKLAAEVVADLNCYKGAMGAADVQACFNVNNIDSEDPATGRWMTTVDFMITHA